MNKLKISASTDIGDKRNNQDTVYIENLVKMFDENHKEFICEVELEESLIVTVCDGIGGGYKGEKAAEIVAEKTDKSLGVLNDITSDFLSESDEFYYYINQVNSAVLDYYKQEYDAGGTTMAFARLIKKDDTIRVQTCNIGDSPIYILKDGKLHCLTIEHTVAYAKQLRGETATERDKNCLIYFVGNSERSGSKMGYFHSEDVFLEEDDILLVCSDGVSKYLSEEEIIQILSESGNPTPKLVEAVKTKTDQRLDNITAVTIKRLRT